MAGNSMPAGCGILVFLFLAAVMGSLIYELVTGRLWEGTPW